MKRTMGLRANSLLRRWITSSSGKGSSCHKGNGGQLQVREACATAGAPSQRLLCESRTFPPALPASVMLPSVSRRYSGVAPIATQERDLQLQHCLPVNVGSLVKVSFPDSTVAVDIQAGDSLEHVLLEPTWEAGACTDESPWLQLSATHTDVALCTLPPSPARRHDSHHVPLPSRLRVHIPERFCSVEVVAGAGAVSVQTVTEGFLDVVTAGGDVTIGKMKGSATRLMTSGGKVVASQVTSEVSVNTGGGSLEIGRLLSQHAEVATGGGDISIRSIYGDDLKLETGGGSFSSKHMRTSRKAVVSTGGGGIKVDGFDGVASFSSGGGSVVLQLHQHAQEVVIDSDGGDVLVFLPPTLLAKVEHHGSGSFTGDTPSGSTSGAPPPPPTPEHSQSGRIGRGAQPGPGLEECPECHLVIRSGAGSVEIRKRSWMEAVTGA